MITKEATVTLVDGRIVPYVICVSKRYKRVRLKWLTDKGFVVTAPAQMSVDHVRKLVRNETDWMTARLDQAPTKLTRPTTLCLQALGETWSIEYAKTHLPDVNSNVSNDKRVVLYGNVDNVEQCCAALRICLTDLAREKLTPLLDTTAAECGMKFDKVAYKNQKTKWGSYSKTGLLSLNIKLLFLPKTLVRYVMIHELCHTFEFNHSPYFWSLVREFEPNVANARKQLKDAFRYVPGWI